ncbi:unnamed protein product, partial [Didymodactylos carnosus]
NSEGDEEEEEQATDAEVNDDRRVQLQNVVIRMLSETHIPLLSKLYDAMKHLRVKRKSKSLLTSSSLLQPVSAPNGRSSVKVPWFRNDISDEESLLVTAISDICQLVVIQPRVIQSLLEYTEIFGDWNYLWPFLVP